VRKGDIKRGSLQIMLATIAISPKQRTLHVDSGTTLFHLKALTAQSFEQWLQCIRARRSVTTNESLWHQDELASATSLVPELITTTVESRYTDNHQVIAKALMGMDDEIKHMQVLVEQLMDEGQTAATSPTDTPQLPPPPVNSSSSSSSSMKLIRFPFIRGSSNNHIEQQQRQQTVEKLAQAVKLMCAHRDRLSTAYYENYDGNTEEQHQHPLEVPSRTGTGFLSHRSASFYSYSANSDQFFDAEDVFLSNEDNESTYGSIDVDSDDEEDHSEDNAKGSD
jgi:hypothetical protein